MVSSCSKVTSRSQTTEEKVRWEKAGARKAEFSLASCWLVPSQMNYVLRMMKRSRMDDIQDLKASVVRLRAHTVAMTPAARQCW